MTNNYNQYESYYTKNACTIVSMLNVLKYRYAIVVEPSYIIKLAVFFDKLGVFKISEGATFTILDKAFIYYLNKKLGLNFKLRVNQISKLSKGDNETYQMGIKGYGTKKYNKAKEGGIIRKKDIDYLTTWSGGIGHALNWDGSAGGYLVDTDGGANTKMSLAVLQYGLSKGLFWDNIRTIDCGDIETKAITDLCIKMFQAEKAGKLDKFGKDFTNQYSAKAKALYFYGR